MTQKAKETGPEKWARVQQTYMKGETFRKFEGYLEGTDGKVNPQQVYAYLFSEIDDIREDVRQLRQNQNANDTILMGLKKKVDGMTRNVSDPIITKVDPNAGRSICRHGSVEPMACKDCREGYPRRDGAGDEQC